MVLPSKDLKLINYENNLARNKNLELACPDILFWFEGHSNILDGKRASPAFSSRYARGTFATKLNITPCFTKNSRFCERTLTDLVVFDSVVLLPDHYLGYYTKSLSKKLEKFPHALKHKIWRRIEPHPEVLFDCNTVHSQYTGQLYTGHSQYTGHFCFHTGCPVYIAYNCLINHKFPAASRNNVKNCQYRCAYRAE